MEEQINYLWLSMFVSSGILSCMLVGTVAFTDLKYSAKESSFTDKGELVAVSLDMLFTIHAEYPRPFSKSHLKVLPLNLPN